MLPFRTLCVFIQILRTYSLIFRDSHNIMIRDTLRYTIDLSIDDQDYEMIDVDELNTFNATDEDKLQRLSKILTSKKNSRGQRKFFQIPKLASTDDYFDKEKEALFLPIAPFIFPITKRSVPKRESTTYNKNDTYFLLFTLQNETLHGNEAENLYPHTKQVFKNGLKENLQEIKEIDGKILKCVLSSFMKKPEVNEKQTKLLWKIIKISCCIYLALAIPLWCTKGWCSCCLCCKFLKPNATIEEAKAYLITNPPGILKSEAGKTCYEPTENEIFYYEEFEHLLKTI